MVKVCKKIAPEHVFQSYNLLFLLFVLYIYNARQILFCFFKYTSEHDLRCVFKLCCSSLKLNILYFKLLLLISHTNSLSLLLFLCMRVFGKKHASPF